MMKISALIVFFFVLQISQTRGEWEQVPLYGGSVKRLFVNRYSPNKLFAIPGSGSGLFMSNDTGTTWQRINGTDQLIADEQIVDLEITVANKIFLLLGGIRFQGYLTSDDFGMSWKRNQLPDSIYLGEFESCDDGTMYMFTQVSGVNLSKSLDWGLSWKRLIIPDTLQTFFGNIYVHHEDSRIIMLSGRDGYAIRSSDGGYTWRVVNRLNFNASATPVSYNYNSKSKLYLKSLSRISGQGYIDVYTSEDLGITWRKVNAQSIPAFGLPQGISKLIDTGTGTLFQLIDNHLYVSSDSGLTWSIRRSMPYMIWDIARVNNKLISNFSFIGMQVSYDDGISWSGSTTGMVQNSPLLIKTQCSLLFTSILNSDHNSVNRRTVA